MFEPRDGESVLVHASFKSTVCDLLYGAEATQTEKYRSKLSELF